MTDLAVPAGTLTEATRSVAADLAGIGRLGVAFSGGVDSSVLLALAARALGADRVVAILGVSPSLAADERRGAHEVARLIGVPVVEVATHEGDRAAYRANGPDRCFHCKDELFTRIGDEVVAAHRPGRDRVRRERRRRRPPGPAGRPGGQQPSGAAAAGRRRPGQGRRAPDRPRAGTCRAPTSPPRPVWRPASRTSPGRHPGEAAADRAGRGGAAPAGICRPAGAAPRRHRPDRTAGRRIWSAPSPSRCAARSARAVLGAGFRSPQSISAACSPARSPCRWSRSAMADGRGPASDSTGIASLDPDRARRRGYPEAVYCEGKTADQVGEIAAAVARPGPSGHPVHPGRAGARRGRAAASCRTPATTRRARCWPGRPTPAGAVRRAGVVLAAGTSDLPVAREAR